MKTLKEKIIDAAYELFGQKGYDKTTVAEIIKKAGASKGGFYHHFESKEEILETITFAYVDRIRALYQEILDDQSMTVKEKFVESYYRINEMKVQSVDEWDKIKNLYANSKNHVLLVRMGYAFEKATADYYEALIERGVEEGSFHTAYPKQLAALWGREVIRFQQMSRKTFMDGSVKEEDFYQTLRFNEQVINQQLGLGEKDIELEAMGKAYLAAMRERLKGRKA
jgi:AcrR family transcriptional regulator